MKNYIKTITVALGASILLFSSCRKHSPSVNTVENISANINMNQSYQFNISGVSHHQSPEITQQASFAAISVIENASTPGNFVYNYTPSQNYTGTDQVTIQVGGNEHKCGKGHCHHAGNCCNGGGCKHHDNDNDADDNTTTYIIKLNIIRTSTPNNNLANTQNAGLN